MNSFNSGLRIKTPKNSAAIVQAMQEEVDREFPEARWLAMSEEKCDTDSNFCKTIYYYYLYNQYDETGKEIRYPTIQLVRKYQQRLYNILNQRERNAKCLPGGCSIQGGRRHKATRRRRSKRKSYRK